MPTGRMYTVQFNNVTISAVQDLIAIVAAAAKNCEIAGVVFGAASGAAPTEQLLRIRIRSGQTTVGSGGGAYTPVPTSVTTAAAGFTARINDTTIASAGTIVQHHSDAWNTRIPFVWIPPEDMRIQLTGSRRATFELVGAPSAGIACNGTMYVKEFG